MTKLRALLVLLALLCSVAMRGAETNESLTITTRDNKGELELDLKTGIATHTNGVMLKYGPTVLTADVLQVDQRTGDVFALGNVVLQRADGQLWRGERLDYNFKTKVISGNTFRAGQPPYFAAGDHLLTNPTNQHYTATNGIFTTDDNANPNYRVRAKKIVIVPGQSIEARHAVLYLGRVPVMYFPYYRKEAGRHPNNYEFLAGYRSQWGAYLLNTYNWYWDERLSGELNFDLRSKRGLGEGAGLNFKDPTFGEALFRYYYTHDEDPTSTVGYAPVPEDRQRALFDYQWNARSNLTVKSQVAYQSDPFVLRDFFESEYHDDTQPNSFTEVNKQWSNWNLNTLAQYRVNDFQETVERLPEVRLSGLRQQIGPTPLYYESESSAGYFTHLYPNQTNLYFPNTTNAFSAARVDSFQQFLVPLTFFGWLNVTPRVGGRLTYYSEANGRGTTTSEELRGVFNTGAEITWKASRLYRQAESSLLDVNGLRHILEPSINYVYVPAPNVAPKNLPQFDSQLPTTELLPLVFPDYNSIDSIDSQQTLRLGFRTKLQTKREGHMENLLNWNLYGDWRITPNSGQTRFSDTYSSLDIRPRSWLTFNFQNRFSIDEGKFILANQGVTVQPAANWSVSLNHLNLVNTPELGTGYNLIVGTLHYRLNENWGLRFSEYFDVRAGLFNYQYYTLYRDFRSWTSALTFRVTENSSGGEPTDYTVAFTFSLKAFPRYGVGDDAVRPSRLIGG